MYIHEYGKEGSFHLAREIIQNCFDECLDDDSPGNWIGISYDKSTDVLRVEDNGRGFPEKDVPLSIIVTKLQSGSKFFRGAGTASAGEFGVGGTVVNALSDIYNVTSYREAEGTKHVLEYREGRCIKDKITKSKGKHGSCVEFKASSKYMGADCELPIDDVCGWIESLFYLDSDRLRKKGIKCEVEIYDGLTLEDRKKFKPKEFYDLLDFCRPASVKKKQMTPVCYFQGETSFMENSKTLIENEDGTSSVEEVPTEKVIHMDIAFQYCVAADVSDNATYDTYCNYTNTIENGTHLDAFEEAFCRYVQNAVNAGMSENQRNKLQVKWDDIRTNLFAVISLSTNAAVGFVGNAKEKIQCPDILPFMKEIVTDGLDNFFKKNQQELNTIIKVVKLNAKARQEATKAKVATQTERVNTLSEH